MVYQEKNDNGWKLHGFLLLMGPWKGTDWYTTNNENIILIVTQHRLQMKQTANFRLAVSVVDEIRSFVILRTKEKGDLPLIPTTLYICDFSGYLINIRCHYPGKRKGHDNLGISLNASWCTQLTIFGSFFAASKNTSAENIIQCWVHTLLDAWDKNIHVFLNRIFKTHFSSKLTIVQNFRGRIGIQD